MQRKDLDRELRNIKRSIDCTDCPEDKHCCIFKDEYRMGLSKHSVNLAFSEEEKKTLMLENRLVKEDRHYALKNGRCPFLDNENSCSRYYERDALGLTGCDKFPLYSLKENGIIKIIVDYRCNWIEQDWEQIESSVKKLRLEGFPADVIYDTPIGGFQVSMREFLERSYTKHY